jgi:hypothetical protein
MLIITASYATLLTHWHGARNAANPRAFARPGGASIPLGGIELRFVASGYHKLCSDTIIETSPRLAYSTITQVESISEFRPPSLHASPRCSVAVQPCSGVSCDLSSANTSVCDWPFAPVISNRRLHTWDPQPQSSVATSRRSGGNFDGSSTEREGRPVVRWDAMMPKNTTVPVTNTKAASSHLRRRLRLAWIPNRSASPPTPLA